MTNHSFEPGSSKLWAVCKIQKRVKKGLYCFTRTQKITLAIVECLKSAHFCFQMHDEVLDKTYGCVSPLLTNKVNPELMCDIGSFDERKQLGFYHKHKGRLLFLFDMIWLMILVFWYFQLSKNLENSASKISRLKTKSIKSD